MSPKVVLSINFLLILTTIILAIVQVVIFNRESTAGEKLSTIMRDIEDLEKENSKLSTKIASASSIATISAKANILGLTDSAVIVSFFGAMPLASLDRSSL